jgi:hypothetical protein
MNDPLRKPQGNSRLNRLPIERQEALVQFAATHTLAEAAAWLGKGGVTISRRRLGTWLSTQRLRQQLSLNAMAIQTLVKTVKSASKAQPQNWDPEQIQRLGQSFFSAMALQQQNPNIWNMTQRLALLKEQLTIDQSKFKESLRSKLQMGLEALAEAFRENPQAMSLYDQARALIDTETK